MINCMILDDQQSSLDLLTSFADKTENLHLLTATSDPLGAISYVEKHPEVNLIFLDVEMPAITGFDFLDMVQQQNRNNLPLVVLTTGNSEYAMSGYQFDQVVGFLHKVVTYRKFLEAVHKVERLLPLYEAKSADRPNAGLNGEDDFFVKVCFNRREKYIRLRFSDLLYLQSQRNYVSLVTQSATYSVRRPLQDFKKILPSTSFIQTHKSYIVNLHHIQHIDGANITLLERHTVPISITYRESIMKSVTMTVITDR